MLFLKNPDAALRKTRYKKPLAFIWLHRSQHSQTHAKTRNSATVKKRFPHDSRN